MIRFLWVAVCTAIVGASPLTNDKDGSRIMNGKIATEGQFPFAVSLQITWENGRRNHICSISLITPKTCLGAAHCVVQKDHSLTKAEALCGIVGSVYQDEEFDCHKLADVRAHEEFDRLKKGLINDIALFIFEDAIDLTDNAKTVKIAGPGKDINDKEVTALGWGVLKQGGFSPHRLRYASLHVAQHSVCQKSYGFIRDNQVCLLGDHTGTCAGDSGGPIILAKSNVQIAIVSFGKTECDTFASMNTDVRMFSDWILEHAEGEPEVEN